MLDGRLVAGIREDRSADGETLEQRLRQEIVRRGRDCDGRRLVGGHALAVRQHPCEPKVGCLGYCDHLHTHQHEPQVVVVVVARCERVEVVEHLLAAVIRLDATAVEGEAVVETMPAAERHTPALEVPRVRLLVVRGGIVLLRDDVCGILLVSRIRLLGWRINADADDLFCLRNGTDIRVNQSALGTREVAHRFRRCQYLGPQIEAQLRAELQMWKQHAALRGDLETADCERMPQPEEHQCVVRPMLTLDVLDQPTAPGTDVTQPVQFVCSISRTFAQSA